MKAAPALAEGAVAPAITVGVPCWNVEGYVGECLASVVGQSFGDFEIVAIDDGSTDGTGRLLDEWVGRDGRVRVVHRRWNMGLGPARNEILRLARGRYVTFVDSDDWLAPECLEKAYRRAEEGDLDVVTFGWVRIEDGSGRVVERRHDHDDLDLADLDGLRKGIFMARLNMLSCARLVRTSLFHDHALLYPDVPHEDLYVTPFLFLYGRKFGYIDETLYYWRIRDDSIMNTISRSHIDGIIGIFHAWKGRLSAEERFDHFRDSICSGVFSYFSSLLKKIEKIGNNDPDLLRYFRGRVRSIPECEAYRLSPEGRQNHAKVVAFLEKESGKDESFPLLAATNQRLKNPGAGQKVGQVWDIVFSAHKDYHVVIAVPIARLLRRWGLKVAFLDFTDVRDEGSLKTLEWLGEKHYYSSRNFIASDQRFKVITVFNDWDVLTTRPLVLDARGAGAATVGFVEGINDFDDVDTGSRRDAYRSVEWVLGAGRYDRHYFGDLGDKFRVVGFPRIAAALAEPYRPPEQQRAVINVNFSYNVLEEQRDAWLESAIEGCRRAEMEWVVSQHPQDRGDLSSYPVDERSFEEVMGENAVLISRFSSCIIEALAMGRGVVYHNPGTEWVEKFRDPLGAYSVSVDAAGLAAALKVELERLGEGGERRRRFLEEHCDVSHDFRPHEKAAQALWEIHGQQAWQSHRPRERAITRLARNRKPMQLLRRSVHIARRVVALMPRLAGTSLALTTGLALVGVGVFGGPWGAWPAVGGLVLIGLVMVKEAVLWRRQQRQAGMLARRMQARAQALAKALAAERQDAQQALAKAVTEERKRSEQALAEALAAERQHGQQALTEAVTEERKRSEQALAKALAAERKNAQQALTKAVTKERERVERIFAEERSARAAVAGHLADRGLPLRRVLLVFTIHRSGSTWLFDLLRTHPAARVETTARVWEALGLNGWRYPGAFHHAAGAVLPLEIRPGRWAEIPAFPRACISGVASPSEAERWALEKAHPEFAGFDVERLAARVLELRGKGVEVELVYGVRKPLDSMWSMAEYKARNPGWYRKVPLEEVPRFIARSLDSLAEARALMGGSVIDYESLPEGAAMRALGRRLDPAWGEAEAAAWLSHAAGATCRQGRQQRAAAGFLGERDGCRHEAGPDGAWAACGAEIAAADAAYRRLVAGGGEG